MQRIWNNKGQEGQKAKTEEIFSHGGQSFIYFAAADGSMLYKLNLSQYFPN